MPREQRNHENKCYTDESISQRNGGLLQQRRGQSTALFGSWRDRDIDSDEDSSDYSHCLDDLSGEDDDDSDSEDGRASDIGDANENADEKKADSSRQTRRNTMYSVSRLDI